MMNVDRSCDEKSVGIGGMRVCAIDRVDYWNGTQWNYHPVQRLMSS
ncbi:hypothetical protein [Microcoleus sp. bin38.metabat.b11b12b14.051]|nr:hypothetical protein [Microcoleus sp. bin38.metabat.b11b12b14.051]